MKTLLTFCQRTGRRLRLYINRQSPSISPDAIIGEVAPHHNTGQLKISVAFSLPFLAKVEVSYQVQFDEKADNDNKPK
ncbi:hypothetical protein [Mesorhizobium sp. M0296]|uniref:hypothetical protein n=1 Tax=Mesorhizobium sp. M0296 TaxID=2956931 RepID=UPI003338A14F